MDYFPTDLYYSEAFLPPIVDHRHERPHPHPSLVQYLTHRKPHVQPLVTQPDVDIRDSGSEYIIEVELPGLTDKTAVKMEWTSGRSLLLEGTLARPPIPDAPVTAKLEHTETTSSTKSNKTDPTSEPTLVVGERKIGPFRRHFNFPVDVETKGLKAKLETGLLLIRVPKKHIEVADRSRVHIE